MFVWICIALLSWLIVVAPPAKGKTPIHYAGQPNLSSPGRCWCRWHGPRGGCIKWVCHGPRRPPP